METDQLTTDTGPFSIVPHWILDAGLSKVALRVYCVLAEMADRKNGQSWPGRPHLAKQCSCSTRSVTRALRDLETAGALKTTRRHHADGGYASNLYTVIRARTPMDKTVTTPIDTTVHTVTRTSKNGRRSASSEEATQLPLPPPSPSLRAAPTFRVTVCAFYEAPSGRKVAALIDMAASLGIARSGLAAKIIKEHGAGREVVRALEDAAAEARGDPWSYMLKELKNGTGKANTRNTGSRQRVATPADLERARDYAAGKTDRL